MFNARASTTSITGIGGAGKTALATWAVLRSYYRKSFEFIVCTTAKDRELTSSGIKAIDPQLTSFDTSLDSIFDVLGFPIIPLQARQVHGMFWICGSPQGSIAQFDQRGINGWAARVCCRVWDGGAVHRALGGASLACRLCLCRVRRTSGVAAEGAPAGV